MFGGEKPKTKDTIGPSAERPKTVDTIYPGTEGKVLPPDASREQHEEGLRKEIERLYRGTK